MMPLYIVTISSKGQFTIPKRLREHLGVRAGDKVSVTVEGDAMVMRSHGHIIEKLAGSLAPVAKKEEVADR